MKIPTLALGLLVLPCMVASNPNALSADFTGQFVCDQRISPDIEDSIEDFLRAQGFRVLNLGKLQRTHGVFLIRTRVIGIDEQDRMIDILSLDSTPGRYGLRLNTAPPTLHSADLEAKLESFPSGLPSCKLIQSSRGSNDSDALALFKREVSRVKGLYLQAESLSRSK
jgi:hypothetical protein